MRKKFYAFYALFSASAAGVAYLLGQYCPIPIFLIALLLSGVLYTYHFFTPPPLGPSPSMNKNLYSEKNSSNYISKSKPQAYSPPKKLLKKKDENPVIATKSKIEEKI